MSATPESLQKFIDFCKQHITGKEKKEAQTFLDRFFKAFGYEGALEAGAKYEEAIKKGSQKGKTGFADLIWKPKVLIEMKQRGEDLNKHYAQAFAYWQRLVPNRPSYVILCNFDEFWIFDFDNQLDEPVDKVALINLVERASAFAFMESGNRTPVFRNNQVEITEIAARRMGELFTTLQQRLSKQTNSELIAQRFILQCVLAMFAEDRGLLPQDLFIACVQDCLQNKLSSYDIIGGLFREMNQTGITPAGRYKGVDYFNGGLFSTIYPIDLTEKELEFLDVAARQDWSKVRPAIFGNIFEGSVNKKDRHSYGIHYTSESDIMNIVRPTISQYWEERIEGANTLKQLYQLQLDLLNYKVLDPACGSGNFLYIAYQELKRIEQLLIDKIMSKKTTNIDQLQISFVTPHQFYGMDLNPFAVELARVTLMIARKVAIDKFNLTENSLPLDTLDDNIVCKDALFNDWVKADAIIGNPPFLGGKKLRQELGDNYAEKVYQQFPEVKGQTDFCVFWFRKAHNNLDAQGRAGLVGTNSISQNVSRNASLDYIVSQNGFIYEAVSTQVWSGEANVHVSIVNWSKEKPAQYFLDNIQVSRISTSLTNQVSVENTKRLNGNKNYSFESCGLRGKGFIVSEEEANKWIMEDPVNQQVLTSMIDGRGLIYPWEKLDWVIDFANMTIEEASIYKKPFERVENTVKPEREKQKRASRQKYWWRFGEYAPKMRNAIKNLSCYFAIPKIAKYILFQPVDISILPCEANMVIASQDFYILGILTSNIHRIWVKAQSSTLKGDTRYTNTTCFETFPFPQTPTKKVVEKIRETMIKLHEYRTEQMEKKQWGITQLYNNFFTESSSQLYKLHQQLDKLAMEAYEFNPDDDLLEKLLKLNLELAEKEERGEKIVGCWDIYQ
ncbi:N-6 DNA methylase [Planktothrix agardhii 1029]|uniref:DNA methyltransferase n=1 Tax=Planktothrix agardhii TaxID=1160 RepID=UPI001D0B8B97|nr:DNA methyltransferase [Planktothrix agardhii]MCB8763227.1 N-6 DNA methylase [Planktothrix agardhii 1809]MCB8781307.1 N-6 DNA methylase [Planktothrix agardhii 1808]MCF3567507.1 N-6 DNA methylase [Planktothrix agardhii 1807]MCF3590844.1 N-6 DNA methylase [Planktothrix agardhii 1029]MCF3619691.1 N-6 DNA methylase [Planktothrix agardhii 1030]